MKSINVPLTTAAIALNIMLNNLTAAEVPVRLITLDPGHFHAGLVQKFMYPQVSPTVHVYSPGGPELQEHVSRIESYNKRADNPTAWELKVHTGKDFLRTMSREKPGNVVVISGNNARKTEYISESIGAGLNVLADKPMAIDPAGFKELRKAFEISAKTGVLLYDIMTERSEITSILQRELAHIPELFGEFEKGTPENPAVIKESIHHYFKEVSGKPVVRPPWFYDVLQQGEAIPDVGTHLVDLIQWGVFPNQVLDWKKDIKVVDANRWATSISPEQFKRSTGLQTYPQFLKKDVGTDGTLRVYSSGDATFTLRGIHSKVVVIWNYEAPPGAKDRHFSLMRGTKAGLTIRQGAEEKYQATLYVENRSGATAEAFEKILKVALGQINQRWPGVEVVAQGKEWKILIPDKYNVGHEAHFSEVTSRFLEYLSLGKLPEWEVPNMIAKYYTTTEAYRISRSKPAKK